MTFPRAADGHLAAWMAHPRRKPLILRGARQTGKTTAVRALGESCPLFLELNLERHEDLALVRSCRSPDELLTRLEVRENVKGIPPGSLLFLDEVQEHLDALRWLRFFYEDRPELAVVAAGSLLEVRLREESLPFPVGRVEFLRMEPLTYLEFLRATGEERLAEELELAYVDAKEVAPSLHELAMERLREFLLVGGLPEAVDVWASTRNLVDVGAVHRALRQAYVEDLLKYRVRAGTRHLEMVLASAPEHYGSRFKLRHLVPGEKDRPIREALTLLEQAMVVHRAKPTVAKTPPLVPRSRAAQKLLPLDMGLALAEMGVRSENLADRPVESILGGRVAEAFVGVQLLAAHPDEPRSFFFWTREGGSTLNAEVDFVVPSAAGILPVEVKAGAAGSLKSMHQFLSDAETTTGVRLSSSAGKTEQLETTMTDGRVLRYGLRSVPLYLAELVASRGIG